MAKIMEQSLNVNEVSRISTGTVIKGEISSPSDIRIDGTFEGKIFSKGRVVVGDKATIKGDIICDNIDFWGRIDGALYVRDTLSLKEGCTVNADLHIKRLVVELGAKFDGNCKMLAEGEFEKLSSTVAASVAGRPTFAPAPSPAPAVQEPKQTAAATPAPQPSVATAAPSVSANRPFASAAAKQQMHQN